MPPTVPPTLLALGVPAPGDIAVPVVGGTAHEPYGTGLFAVRPDGHVGWAGDPAAGAAEYLARFGGRW